MHYHLEIIMPPTDDVHAAVAQIMAPFDENGIEDDDHSTKHAFWDFWQVSGRYSGQKLLAYIGEEREAAFRKALDEEGVTVAGLRFGKPTLQPADQLPRVNEMWNAAFPDAPVKECPLFDSYKGNWGDVMPLRDIPVGLMCGRVIIAGLDWQGKKLAAHYMLIRSLWNGVTHQDAAWDGSVQTALADWEKHLGDMNPEWAAQRRPQPDWLVVTVDYHS